LVITIPSKGRLQSETFRLLESANNLDIFVYVYVDELEYTPYQETYPNYNIIPHDKKTINDIRAFIQEHQHGLGNNMIMMDDDIKFFKDINGYSVSFNKIIRDVKEALEKVDFVYFHHDGLQGFVTEENEQSEIFTAASVIAMSTNLYEKGVVYHNNVISEDFDFYFQVLLNNAKWRLLPYFINKNTDINVSNFDLEFRNKSIIETYLKYGDVINLRLDLDELHPNIAEARIKEYKKHGAVYSDKSDFFIHNIWVNKSPGWQIVEKDESALRRMKALESTPGKIEAIINNLNKRTE
jgi:hypothetical protein